MNDADIAPHEAKRNGRNRCRIFHAEHREKVRDKKLLSDEFLAGLERGELIAQYQPQLCARTGALVAIEALARWNHPTRGVLAPSAFLGIAEALNMLSEVNTRVFRHGHETGSEPDPEKRKPHAPRKARALPEHLPRAERLVEPDSIVWSPLERHWSGSVRTEPSGSIASLRPVR